MSKTKRNSSTATSAATMATVKESFREAIKAQDVETVRTILTTHRGLLNLNNLEKDEQYSHLMLGALAGSLEIVKLLVEVGRCDADIQNNDGQTALMFASYKGHADVVSYLIEKGARKDFVDNVGQSALDLAATDEIRAILSDAPQEVPSAVTSSSEDTPSPTRSGVPRRNRSVLSDVFSDPEALSSLVQQSLETHASAAPVDYSHSLLREKEKQLAETEAELKIVRTLSGDLEAQLQASQLAMQSEVNALNEQLAELTVKYLNASEQVEEQKKMIAEQNSLNEELQTRVSHLEHELNKVTAELDCERSTKSERDREIERFAGAQCDQEEEMDRLRAKLVEFEELIKSNDAKHARELDAMVAVRESKLLLAQQQRYDTQMAEKDRQIAQLEKIVDHLTEEMELKGWSSMGGSGAVDGNDQEGFCVVS